MNGIEDVWETERETAGGRDVADVIEVVLSWCDAPSPHRGREPSVLAVRQVVRGRVLTLGERGDILVPEEVLKADRVEIVRYDGDAPTAIVPQGASAWVDGVPCERRVIELCRGRIVELSVAAFAARIARTPAAGRPAVAPLEGLRRSGAGFLAGSAFLHVAAFGVVALFAPALGATEEDPFDTDRLLLVQRLLDASAQRELERMPDDASASTGGDVDSGRSAIGAEGAAGKPDTNTNGRWAARGSARAETATLARERELAAAETNGVLGMLSSASFADPNAPVVTWGTVQNGSDDLNRIGRLFGGSVDDARGTGGLGLSGLEQGGGGVSNAIGLNDVRALGHTGSCTGDGPCDGVGVGRDKPHGGHVSRFKGPRYASPAINGRLDAAVIQRVVRLNDGRYRFCYENGLRGDPSLQGRVTVKFVIGRDGAVAVAADGGSDIPDQNVRRCVVQSFMSLSFPEPESGTVTVVYPIVFSPD